MTRSHTAARSSAANWIDASARHQPLCERTVIELARRVQRWQQYPDGPELAPKAIKRSALRARDQLVNHNLRLVAHIWQRRSISSSLPAQDEGTADALQEAALNLVRAAEKFDPTKGYRFSTYATFWVQRGIHDYQQRYVRAIRFPAEKASLMLKAQRLIESEQARSGQWPDITWLASQLRFEGQPLSAQAFTTMFEQWQQSQIESLDHAPGVEEEAGALSRIDQASLALVAKQEQDEQDQADVRLLAELMQCLDGLEQRLIRNRYLRRPALSPCQLRRSMGGLKQAQLQQLEGQALAKLRQAAAERQALAGTTPTFHPTALEQGPKPEQPLQPAGTIGGRHRSRPSHRPGASRQPGRQLQPMASRSRCQVSRRRQPAAQGTRHMAALVP